MLHSWWLKIKIAPWELLQSRIPQDLPPSLCEMCFNFTFCFVLAKKIMVSTCGESWVEIWDLITENVLSGWQVQEAYARYHRDEFALFVSKDFVLGLLQQGYGPLDRRHPALIDFLHSCLRLLISCPAVLEVATALQTEVLRMVCERPEPALCARLATLLADFPQCVPRDKGQGALFCQQLVRTMSHFQCAATQEKELREYVAQVNRVSALLQGIWKAEPAALLPSLQEVFAIISSTGETRTELVMAQRLELSIVQTSLKVGLDDMAKYLITRYISMARR